MSAAELPGTAVPAPPPGMVVTGRYDEGPGYRINRPAGANSWLLTWTTDGSGLLRQGAVETTARAGDLVVLAPGVPHSYAVGPGARRWRFWWTHCQVRPHWMPWLAPRALGDGVYAVGAPDGTRARIEAAFQRVLADSRWTGTGAPPAPAAGDDPVVVAHGSAARALALCALEEAVLLATAGAHPAAPGGDAGDERVRRAEELIAADPAAPHTVRSLAARVALSPSRFAHLFTARTGVPPMRALREARLRHAARLLESSDLTVERVAAASGFPSPFHFNRVFRERYGVPPGAYRAGERP